jgi:Fe2+ transport system protein FeoA
VAIENDFQRCYEREVKSVADLLPGQSAMVRDVGGPRAFRRRLLEMGLVPGTQVRLVTVAPLGDPMQIEVRSGQWSIRREEAAQIELEPVTSARMEREPVEVGEARSAS